LFPTSQKNLLFVSHLTKSTFSLFLASQNQHSLCFSPHKINILFVSRLTKSTFSLFPTSQNQHSLCFSPHKINILFVSHLTTSNGNDMETKRNDISIIGAFSVSKQNEPAYSRTLKDRSKANIFMSTLCRTEVNTNWVCPKLSRIEQKRAGLVQNFPGSNKNELG
jgi:hypothetical protein